MSKRGQGQGSIIKAKDGRKKCYLVYAPSFRDDNGKRKRKLIGSFETKKEAETYLSTYLMSDLESQSLNSQNKTLKEVFDEVYNRKVILGSPENTLNYYKKAYNRFKDLWDCKLIHIKSIDLQNRVDGLTRSTQKQAVIVLRQVYAYAIKHNYVDKDLSNLEIKTSVSSQVPIKQKKIVNIDTINLFKEWVNSSDMFARRYGRFFMILLYTGARPNEIINMNRDDVDLENNFMYCRSAKTVSSVRKIYIHKEIKDIIEYLMRDDNNLGLTDKLMDFSTGRVNSIIAGSNLYLKSRELNHSLYDFRHTFLTQAFKLSLENKLNFSLIDLSVGHTQKNVALDFYIHLSDDILYNEINKVSYS